MDAVFVLKQCDQNPELRYSLRSLKNVPVDRVWIAGHKPEWVQGVWHLPVHQVAGEKHPNSLRIQRAVLGCPDISDPFMFWHDDFFAMQPMSEVPVLNWGPVDRVIAEAEGLGFVFRQNMIATRKILRQAGYSDPISYQLHVPLVVHKEPYLQAMDQVRHLHEQGQWIQHATIYGNQHGLGGETLERDVKVLSPYQGEQAWWSETSFLSTLDASFLKGAVGKFIRRRFPDPSPYE